MFDEADETLLGSHDLVFAVSGSSRGGDESEDVIYILNKIYYIAASTDVWQNMQRGAGSLSDGQWRTPKPTSINGPVVPIFFPGQPICLAGARH